MATANPFQTKYGCFSQDGKEYVISTPRTPRPWINVISNGDYGMVVSQTGSGYSFRTHAQLNRITRWEQDLVRDDWGKYIYLCDDRGRVWSAGWKPVCHEPNDYSCTHGTGYTRIRSRYDGIESDLLMFVPCDDPMEVWHLRLRNGTRTRRKLRLLTYLEWGLGAAPDWHREFHRTFFETEFSPRARAVLVTKRLWEIPTEHGHWNADWKGVAFHSSSAPVASFDTDKESFLGPYGSLRAPRAVREKHLRRRAGNALDPVGSLEVVLELEPGEEKAVSFTLGAADSRERALQLAGKYEREEEVQHALDAVTGRWDTLLGATTVQTPDPALDILHNTWLKYQAISGRLWARTAYYQVGGAYGFRDQLQDSQIFLPIDPDRTREQIRLHARHQFKDGTVYHWWHPITETGLHAAITDNLLWLPFVANSYLQETDDETILEDREPFVDDPVHISLYEHCTRAIEKAMERTSPRGLPLIGAGDWNDGLSAVGLEMKGESVWLGHFLHGILSDFSLIAARRGDGAREHRYRDRAAELKRTLNLYGWDGAWYWRATKDSGVKIGSRENTEGRIYLNAQTWAVITGVADPERGMAVLTAAEKELASKAGPLLLAPAYTEPDPEIGYLSRYGAGMRENGGVYTHAATWMVMAEAKLRRYRSAYSIFSKLNPINRGKHADEYQVEPYVTAGNIEGPQSANYGRGGWTWYTGSAAWMFKVGLEWILGVRPTREGLVVDPCIPASWKGFHVRRGFRGAVYNIHVENPRHVGYGVASAAIDGADSPEAVTLSGALLPVFPAGTVHEVLIRLGGRT